MSDTDHPSEFEIVRPDPLPCGCIRYHKMCPEAAALWKKVTEAWDDYHKDRLAETYYAVVARYLAHFENGGQPIPDPPRPHSLTAQVVAAQHGGQLAMRL
jgi:hypothetical protein